MNKVTLQEGFSIAVVLALLFLTALGRAELMVGAAIVMLLMAVIMIRTRNLRILAAVVLGGIAAGAMVYFGLSR